jgi:predicted NUDIX family NTP pyrophosphohydrolase
MKISAGLLMYRRNGDALEILLCHPGGPLYEHKDHGCWGIPKGQVEANETIVEAAFREFTEETGLRIEAPELIPLGKVMERNGKAVYAWAFEGDCNTGMPVESNLFEMEWPPQSGRMQFFPEVDRLAFYTPELAVCKIEYAQKQFIERLEKHLNMGKQFKVAL